MTHKITMKASQATTPGADFAALADQLLQESWHLPPGGDQSWREQDALRIFSGNGKDEINDAAELSSVADADPADGGSGTPYQPGFKPPGFKPPKAFGILLPLATATGLVFLIVMLSAPEILTPGFWNTSAAQAAPEAALASARDADAASTARHPFAPDELRPSLAYAGQAEPLRHAAAVTIRQAQQKPVTRIVKVAAPGETSSHKKPVRRLSPIGEEYFASRASKTAPPREAPSHKLPATRLPPIGEVYFASHAQAAK